MEVEHTKDLADYIDAFRRRKGRILAVVGAILLISIVIAVALPPTYRSTATILIKEQEIPPDLVRSTITSFATQRIETIGQQVMTRKNLMGIVKRHKLYRNKKGATTEEILENMRNDIKIENLDADVIDPRSGRATKATIAFTLSYDGPTPRAAMEVTDELTSLYLNENLKTRKERAADTYSFLSTEAEKLSQQVGELESSLSTFKSKHASSLPELAGLNQQLLNRTETSLIEVDSKLRSAQERKFYLESQIAQLNPFGPMMTSTGERILDPSSRLKHLRSELASASAKYSPDHPDVLRLQREIEGLEQQSGSSASSIEQAKELTKLRGELGAAQDKYSEDHPDVIQLKLAVSNLEEQISKQDKQAKPESNIAETNPDNPAYITLQSQLKATLSELKSLERTKKEYQAKLEDYESRIAQSPEVERKYLALFREHENAIRRYREIQAKQMEAGIGQELEKESKGERFLLIDPPELPEAPISPNRPAIIFLGFILSIAGGFGFAAVAESLDGTVRGARGIASVLNSAPLSIIPYKPNDRDRARKKKVKRNTLVTAVAGVVLTIVIALAYSAPLDVLWFKGLRKIDSVMGG